MIIATFNVNSVRVRLPILERWLKNSSPDFLFMQETKTQDEFFPSLAFQEMGYRSYYHGGKSYNGVAVLVKNNIDDVDVTFGFDDADFDTRVLTLRHKNLTVLNTYVPQGKSIDNPDFEVKKNFLSRVKNIIEHQHQGLFLWLGDLNVAPEKIDVTRPETKKNNVCFCDEIRKVFSETKNSLVDVLRLFDKNSNVFTYYDYKVKDAVDRNIGWRVDHMLASQKLADLAVWCKPDTAPRKWERPSDHVPLAAEFNLE
ncbi:MAG: exodeoxyribonuclease III [Synergistaceae bacterium]|nr:exodeoxyribonuclease III [Synergistaceae bacterium]